MEEKLIELVKRRDFLYNTENPNYKNNFAKDQAWIEIARQLGTTVDVAKRKWKNLRDMYKRVKQTKLPKGEGSNKKMWKHEKRMSFLEDVQCSRVSLIFKTEDTFYEDEADAAVNELNKTEDQQQDDQYDVLYTEVEVSNDADFEIENFDLNDYVKKIDTTATTTTTNTKPTTTSANTATNSNPSYYTVQESDLVRRKKYDKEALIQEACNEMTSLLQNAKKHFTPPSSNQVFFNSLALQVEEAQLPTLTQMRLQQRILEMVTLEIVNHQQNEMQQV